MSVDLSWLELLMVLLFPLWPTSAHHTVIENPWKAPYWSDLLVRKIITFYIHSKWLGALWICIVPLNTVHELQRIPASRHNIDSFIYMFFAVSEVNVHIFNRHKWEWLFQLSQLLLILQYLESRTLLSDC